MNRSTGRQLTLAACAVFVAITLQTGTASAAKLSWDQESVTGIATKLAAAVQELLNEGDPDSGETSLGLASYEVESKTLKWMGPRRRVELRSLGRCRSDAVLLIAVVDVRLPAPGASYPPPQALLRGWTRTRPQ